MLSCTYYRDGSLKSQTDASGKTVYYAYDGDGRLQYLKEDTDTILTEYRYTNAGRIKEIITAYGTRTTYAYDEDGNISRLTIGDGTEEGLLYDAFMLYDLNGNRTGKTGRRLDIGGKQAEMAVSYRYDGMNRLTNEDRDGAGERYAYDLCGNRLLKEQYHGGCVDVTEGYRYNERNELTERIKAGSLTAYQYDKNGSIISEEEEGRRSEYRYDLLNRQTYVKTLEGREQENLYDGENLRAGLTENGKKTTFLYHNGEILTEFDGESAPVKRYLRGIGLSHVQTRDNEAYHAYHQDEQGSTAYITGQGRETENIYQYDAFGNLLENKEEVANRILYTGQQYDQETGQYYLRARYYNPVVRRFLQEDTYCGDGLNLYAYCANNPVVYYDPSGRDGKCNKGNTQNEQVIDLPQYDGKTTHGILVLEDGTQIPFSSGGADPKYKNYIPASHVEGKAAIYMRENGISSGIVYHNNTDGTCPYCDKMLSTLLEEGSSLTVVPPSNAVAPKPSWIDKVKKYIGNEKMPKKKN